MVEKKKLRKSRSFIWNIKTLSPSPSPLLEFQHIKSSFRRINKNNNNKKKKKTYWRGIHSSSPPPNSFPPPHPPPFSSITVTQRQRLAGAARRDGADVFHVFVEGSVCVVGGKAVGKPQSSFLTADFVSSFFRNPRESRRGI